MVGFKFAHHGSHAKLVVRGVAGLGQNTWPQLWAKIPCCHCPDLELDYTLCQIQHVSFVNRFDMRSTHMDVDSRSQQQVDLPILRVLLHGAGISKYSMSGARSR